MKSRRHTNAAQSPMQNPAVQPEHNTNTETLTLPSSHCPAWESFERKKNKAKKRVLVGKKMKKSKNYLNKAKINATSVTICLLVGL